MITEENNEDEINSKTENVKMKNKSQWKNTDNRVSIFAKMKYNVTFYDLIRSVILLHCE